MLPSCMHPCYLGSALAITSMTQSRRMLSGLLGVTNPLSSPTHMYVYKSVDSSRASLRPQPVLYGIQCMFINTPNKAFTCAPSPYFGLLSTVALIFVPACRLATLANRSMSDLWRGYSMVIACGTTADSLQGLATHWQ